MNIPIDNTHLKFIEPLYHFGQKLITPDGWGVVTGMQRTYSDYQQWKYSVVLFLATLLKRDTLQRKPLSLN